ncbi:sigma E factor regulator [Alkalibaculum sp. M08DMB]|uniref:Sigma E factor regulator n=1 Tax=Alkalibaculum sporogenes TaxID=2655001 RepID=A0A6A7K9D1_9FIRM|nr:SoxR reducing system RseC family protein [Alkalibaculum sporogenes]MPW26002.1 sigma E factor regulator [Alkalibaculum sporogenes]
MKEIGIVNSINGNKASVIIQRSAACGDCGACQVGKDRLTMETYAINEINAKAGDKVEVEMAFKNVMKAAIIAYGIPLIMFILGSVLGTLYTNIILEQPENPIISFLSGLILMAVAYMIIRVFDKRGAFSFTYEPHITTIINATEK